MILDALVVPLTMDIKKFVAGLEMATKSSLTFNKIIGIAGPLALGALATGAVTATTNTLKWGETLHDIQNIMGGTTEDAASLAILFQHVGMSSDDLTNALKRMSKGLTDTKGNLGPAGLALKSLGIDFQDAEGNTRPAIDIFQDIANKLGPMADGLDKNSLEMDLFGRSGADMNDALTAAANGGLAAANAEAEKMGLNFSQDKVDKIRKTSMGINDLKTAFSGLGTELVTAALPAMDKVVAVLTWLVENKPALYTVISVLGAVVVLWLVNIAVAAWAAVVPLLPFIAAIAAVGVFIGLMVLMVESAITSIHKWIDIFGDVKGWLEVKIPLAITAFLAGLKIVTDFIYNTVNKAIQGVINLFQNFVKWVNNIITALGNLKLPSWLTPGSPTPLEMGLRGINSAMGELNVATLPKFNASINMNAGKPVSSAPGILDLSDSSLRKLAAIMLMGAQ